MWPPSAGVIAAPVTCEAIECDYVHLVRTAKLGWWFVVMIVAYVLLSPHIPQSAGGLFGASLVLFTLVPLLLIDDEARRRILIGVWTWPRAAIALAAALVAVACLAHARQLLGPHVVPVFDPAFGCGIAIVFAVGVNAWAETRVNQKAASRGEKAAAFMANGLGVLSNVYVLDPLRHGFLIAMIAAMPFVAAGVTRSLTRSLLGCILTYYAISQALFALVQLGIIR